MDRASSDAWRQFVLMELVQYLDQNRELILERYQQATDAPISRDQLDQEGLLDFELALTFLKDRNGWGQGKGFLGMNLIG
ncbi:hypothetical protein [Parasynechococcus sp.]|uniref:hypothetical protein n=1 Tax=Parasynechococcus sp. TaxID=3101203 RepID=UPI003704C222